MNRLTGTSWHRATRTWHRFWFAEGNTFTLGLFRVLFAGVLWHELGTSHGRYVFATEGGFHLPYVSFIAPVSQQVYDWLHLVQYPLVVWLSLGFFSRFAAGGLLAVQGFVFFADKLNFRDPGYLFLLILGLLLFAPLDDSLSLRRWLRARRGSLTPDSRAPLGTWAMLTVQQLIKVQLCLVYLFSVSDKLNEFFVSGRGLARVLAPKLFDGLSGDLFVVFLSRDTVLALRELPSEPGAFVVPSIIVIAAEIFLPVALWNPRLRTWAFLVGLSLHGAIFLLLDIHTISLACLACYLLFLRPSTLPAWLSRQFGDMPPVGVPQVSSDTA